MDEESREGNITMQYILIYVFKMIRIVLLALIITYFIGCFWYAVCELIKESHGKKPYQNFISYNEENFEYPKGTHDDGKALIISCYYALATLSTVGYGDYYPISQYERIIAVIIMLGGVAFFSYIMGEFISTMQNYESKMGNVDNSKVLHNWFISLQRFYKDQAQALPKHVTV